MKVHSCLVLWQCLILVSLSLLTTSGEEIPLESGQPRTISLQPGDCSLKVTNISSIYSYVVFQAHTQTENVSMSSNSRFQKDLTLTGSHVGILNLLQKGENQSVVYLKSSNDSNVTVVIYAQLYTPRDPVPGGCNQIFQLEIDPSIHITSHDYWTDVNFQWANVGFQREQRQMNCEVQRYQGRMKYEIYAFSMADQSDGTFYTEMPKMLGASSIIKHGRKVISLTNTGTSQSLAKLSSAIGQGVVYAIVVMDTENGTTSSYIPVQTYSCRLGDRDCERKYKALDVIIAIICAIFGVFLCFLGHRYFKTELFMFGFIAFTLIFYIVMSRQSTMSTEASIGISSVMGVIGGLVFYSMWYKCGVPVLSVLFVGLTTGYLVSSIIFFTPFGNLSYWDSAMTYGLTFTCGLLIAPVFLLCFTKTLNILACTFLGSYLIALCFDIFLWSSLKFIVLTSIYSQTVPDYLGITVSFPFQTKETILAVLWGVLFIVGTIVQFYRDRNKPPFPACPSHVKKAKRLERPRSRPGDDERQPLLDERSRPSYQGQRLTGAEILPATAPPPEQNQPT